MAQRAQEFSGTDGLPGATVEDKELALAFKRGEDGAYQAIHDRYSARVYSVCRRMLGHDDAQEAAQETFLRVYQALGRFNGRYQLGAWITRIATNVCLDQIRAKSRRPVDPVELEILDLDDERSTAIDDPEAITIRRAESRRVRKTLAQLPPLHRAAIVLRDFEGLSYAEVAVALQITECQVKALIHRARQNFKRSWSPLSVLVPWKLAARFKDVDHVTKDHVAQAAATTSQVAPSCASMLQQCGQYVGQHVATVVTAAIVGTAAGAASHAATQPPKPQVVKDEASRRLGEGRLISSSRDILSKVETKLGRKVVEGDATTRATASPASSDDAAPALSPSPSPTGTQPSTPTNNSATPAPTDSPTPRSTPTSTGPFAPSVGFDWGRAIPNRIPKSYSSSVDCAADVFEQRLETVVDDDDSAVTYPALLQLQWGTASAPRGRIVLEFTLWKNGHEIYYSGTGELVGGSSSGSQEKLEFVGNYGTLNQQAPNMDLPTYGRFTASLTLDCAAPSVVTEGVVLGT